MTSMPATSREYAYFRAHGVFDPAAVTRVIGIEPTESWNVGDTFTRRGHNQLQRFSRWSLASGYQDTEPLNGHVTALLGRLAPHRAGVLEAATMAQLQIVCVGTYSYNFSWELDFASQQMATALGIGFWFDIYGFGDPHEEMVEMRERLGLRGDRPGVDT